MKLLKKLYILLVSDLIKKPQGTETEALDKYVTET